MNTKYNLGLYEKSMPNHLSWKEKLSIAKQLGYNNLEISIDETKEKLDRLYRPELQLEIKNAIKKVGLPIRTMCLSGHRRFPLGSHNPDIRKQSLEIFYRAIHLADYLGIKIIQLAGYDVYYESSDENTRKWFRKNLKKGVEYAAKMAIQLGFETMETEFMNTIEKAMVYVDEINSPYLNVYPDLGNITNSAELYKTKVNDDIDKGRGHILAVHLKETKPGVFREVEFGEGHVNFNEGIKAFWNHGVRYYGLEFWYSDKTNYEERLTHNLKFIKIYLDKMGGQNEI